MYSNDHIPPHFHAAYGSGEALIEIETLAVYRGSLPRRAMALVLESRQRNIARKLVQNWMLARAGELVEHVDPARVGGDECENAESTRRLSRGKGIGLQLTLSDGSVIDRNVKSLLIGKLFKEIRHDPCLFSRVFAANDLPVAWPNGADLCPDVLIWGRSAPRGGRGATYGIGLDANNFTQHDIAAIIGNICEQGVAYHLPVIRNSSVPTPNAKHPILIRASCYNEFLINAEPHR